MPMTGFEPKVFGVGSNRSSNCPTATAQSVVVRQYIICTQNLKIEPRLFFIETYVIAKKKTELS